MKWVSLACSVVASVSWLQAGVWLGLCTLVWVSEPASGVLIQNYVTSRCIAAVVIGLTAALTVDRLCSWISKAVEPWSK